ncbi:MAG: Uma2 family endonuclease [Gemmataceae bacterium]
MGTYQTKPPPLVEGERLDQKTFHERYETMPPETLAELIGGIVYIAPPRVTALHGGCQGFLSHWLGEYETATLGVEGLVGVTDIVGDNSELQPDASLLVTPKYGGQTRSNEDDYLCGAPELVGEVADTAESETIDLTVKKLDYERAGVREYIVVALQQKKVFWFIHCRGKFRELKGGVDGVFRSEVFPGLWLDGEALLRRERKRMLAVLREGLASAGHAEFVKKLKRRRKS